MTLIAEDPRYTVVPLDNPRSPGMKCIVIRNDDEVSVVIARLGMVDGDTIHACFERELASVRDRTAPAVPLQPPAGPTFSALPLRIPGASGQELTLIRRHSDNLHVVVDFGFDDAHTAFDTALGSIRDTLAPMVTLRSATQGIRVTLPGSKFRALASARAAYHVAKVESYATAQAAVTAATQGESVGLSRDPREEMKRSIEEHKGKALFFGYLVDYTADDDDVTIDRRELEFLLGIGNGY